MKDSNNNLFIIGGIVTVVLFIGGVFLLASSGKAVSKEDTLSVLNSRSQENIRGNESAPVKIVEFSDFQCPACAQAKPVLDQLLSEYSAEIQIAYRHFPLRTIHDKAQLAAEAAEAAGAQGKFWGMHDLLFEQQQEWEELSVAEFKLKLVEYGEQIELDDIEQFKTAIAEGTYSNLIDEDTSAASKLDLGGTPSIFVNGEKIDGASYEKIKKAIDDELNI